MTLRTSKKNEFTHAPVIEHKIIIYCLKIVKFIKCFNQ